MKPYLITISIDVTQFKPSRMKDGALSLFILIPTPLDPGMADAKGHTISTTHATPLLTLLVTRTTQYHPQDLTQKGARI